MLFFNRNMGFNSFHLKMTPSGLGSTALVKHKKLNYFLPFISRTHAI